MERIITYKIRLLIFIIFKNKELFQLHNIEVITGTGNTTRATILNWRKEHSRKQTRYQGTYRHPMPIANCGILAMRTNHGEKFSHLIFFF